MRNKDINIEILKAMRRNSRNAEIAEHGKPVMFRPLIVKNKTRYDRKKFKKNCLDD